MAKKEIIKRASEISGISQYQVRNCMEAILVAIKEALSEKKKIMLQARNVVKIKISDLFKFKE